MAGPFFPLRFLSSVPFLNLLLSSSLGIWVVGLWCVSLLGLASAVPSTELISSAFWFGQFEARLLGFGFAISAIFTLKMQGLAASPLPLTQSSLAWRQLPSPVAH